ncbi:MAG: protein kinase, partial [Erysipelotrichaceae bacterium]|nr:protein kinase [Erysipelotrichaceae bacterium]
MNGPLNYSEMIPLTPSGQCEIIDYLDEGGQGYIYITNKNRILKWYKEDINPHIKANILEMLQNKSPYPNITWPIAISKDYKNSFGYVMPRIPRDYISFNYYLYDDVYYLNLEETLQIAYAIVDTFDAIHKKGYIYQDINPNGIMISKKNQSVIVCDVDNCNQKGQSYVMGTKMYMAPEIMLGHTPSLYSDYYSLAVILFQLFYVNHPLEGAKTLSQPLNEALELEYFGKHPVFVCDPINHSNGFYKDYTDEFKQRC